MNTGDSIETESYYGTGSRLTSTTMASPILLLLSLLILTSLTTVNGAASFISQRNNNIISRHSRLKSFTDGTVDVSREYTITEDSSSLQKESSHSLHYRIHNRMNLSSQKAAPILILHGGPGVPSDYLYPLVDVIPYRSLIFYDQLGSGRSPGPSSLDAYSIEKSLDDLELLIKKLNLRRFHLYGQSFGGILAFEYLKRIAERSKDDDEVSVLSVILSSSPNNVAQVEASANAIIEKLVEEDDDMSSLAERFRLQSQCRISEKPQPLVDAYAHAGTIWRGTDVIKEWRAEKPSDGSKRMPSLLVMRGEHDFVSEECVQGWKKVFNHAYVRMKVLEGCSHHGLLEFPEQYGETVDSFFAEYD
jgi:proline iminopeptidase